MIDLSDRSHRPVRLARPRHDMIVPGAGDRRATPRRIDLFQSRALSLRRYPKVLARLGGFRARTSARAKAKPVNSVQIAEALLELEGAPRLAALFSSGRKCDEVPVRFIMLKMFPVASHDELAAGLQLAVTIARLDVAEIEAERRLRR